MIRVLLAALLCAACVDQSAPQADPHATDAGSSACGPAPQSPEISLIESTVDDRGQPAVMVERTDWDRVSDYEIMISAWARCMSARP